MAANGASLLGEIVAGFRPVILALIANVSSQSQEILRNGNSPPEKRECPVELICVLILFGITTPSRRQPNEFIKMTFAQKPHHVAMIPRRASGEPLRLPPSTYRSGRVKQVSVIISLSPPP